MKTIKHFFLVSIASLSLFCSCNKPYDPIGPNKPAPTLILTPSSLGYNGAGGELTAKISSNAELIKIEGDLPDWVESAEVSEDMKTIKITAAANTENAVRRSSLKVVGISGSNSLSQDVKLVQACKNALLSYSSFSGKEFPSGWTAEDASSLSLGNGYLDFNVSSGIEGYLYTLGSGQWGRIYKNDISFDAGKRPYYFSVDIKMNSAETGVALYLNDDPEQVLYTYFSFDAASNKGGIWVKVGKNDWKAMDAGIVGSGGNDNKFHDVATIPDEGERDSWWRLKVYTTETDVDSPVIELTILKTGPDGNTREVSHCYSRKFSVPNRKPGNIALWARHGDSQYRDFVLSYRK